MTCVYAVSPFGAYAWLLSKAAWMTASRSRLSADYTRSAMTLVHPRKKAVSARPADPGRVTVSVTKSAPFIMTSDSSFIPNFLRCYKNGGDTVGEFRVASLFMGLVDP